MNVRTFCESLLASTPQHTVGRIRYFTARVRTQGTYSSGTEQRQDTYLRAIATLGIDVQFGHYQYKPTFATSYPLSNPPKKVQILKAEEKGSDVNLAAWLLLDGFKQDYEQAIVVSNDSDLATPIRMVRDDLKLPVLSPMRFWSEALAFGKTSSSGVPITAIVRPPSVIACVCAIVSTP